LSTDDEDVAKVGKQCGLDVPFMRPDELAQDDTPMLPVVQHAIYKLESMGAYYDAVCLLQPTTPLRTVDTIDGCIHLLEESSADAVATVLKVPVKYNPHWVYFENEKGLLHLSTGEQNPIARRQDLPDAFHREGSVYVARRRTIMEQQSLYGNHFVGYIINQEQHVNIDTLDDWERAERLLESTFS
jgi:CMP-N-acetylneuraminic acid synthetase